MPVETLKQEARDAASQKNLFSPVEGERLKRLGMSRAQSSKHEILQIAQRVAFTVAHHNHFEVTIDEVYITMQAFGQRPELLGNAAGSVFDGPRWEFTGRWVKSKRTTNHGRMIRVWRLKA